jgi:hypothetical protein
MSESDFMIKALPTLVELKLVDEHTYTRPAVKVFRNAAEHVYTGTHVRCY